MAAVGSAVFFVVAPGVVAGLMPWLLTDWEAGGTWLPLQIVGAALVVAGALVLLHSFARFVREGRGTPAPVAPTQKLVVGGLYRYVRNPMYVAVLAVIFGQALLLARWVLVGYGACVFLLVYSFVRVYEEPTLALTYGAEYDEYRRAVPGWLPRPRSLDRRRPTG
jgi:protein-S-isoprenylcysteine O-methyltransferase Ste14